MKLQIKNLHVNVNGKEILKGVDLEINLGKVHALMGPNGSGKCIDINDRVIINNRLTSGKQLLKEVKNVDSYSQEGGLVFKKKFKVYDLYGSKKESIPYFENYQGSGYAIKTKSGREIKVTPDHKLLTFGEKITWKHSKDILGDEFIAIPKKIKLSTNRKLPPPKEWTRRINGEVVILDKSDNFVIKARLPMGWSYYDYEMKVPKEYNVVLVEFFAMLTAEGHVRNNGEVSLTQKDYADKLFKIAKTLDKMGVHARIRLYKKVYVLSVKNRLFSYFLKYGFGIDHNSRVPNTVFDFPEDLRRIYLSWVFTFDGHITKSGHEFEITQKRKNTIDYLLYLLLSFGIAARISTKKINNVLYYRLKISGEDNLKKFLFKIGMFDESKNDRMRLYLKKDKSKEYTTATDLVPFDNERLKDIIKFVRYSLFSGYEKMKEKSWYKVRYRGWKRTVYYMSRKKYKSMITDLRDYLDIIESKNIELPQKIEDIFGGIIESLNFYWDRLEKKEEIKMNGVYDLSVLDEKHSFIGGFGGIILHNSTLANVLMGNPRYEVTKGKILLDKEDITGLSADERAKKGLFLSFQYPAEITGVTMSNFLRTAYNSIKEKKLDVVEFHSLLKKKMAELKIDSNFSRRYINEGFSGGEKKRAEILQMSVLEPKFAILDECDSGLDISSIKIVGEGVNKMKNPKRGILIITHYYRILNYITPDKVYIMVNGKIVEEGEKELAEEIEKNGFDKYLVKMEA